MAGYLTLQNAIEQGRPQDFARQFLGMTPKEVLELTKLGDFFFVEENQGSSVDNMEEKHKCDSALVFSEDQKQPEQDYFVKLTLDQESKVATAALCNVSHHYGWFNV